MRNIFKSPTVEEIHAEFDSGEKRILDECDKILNDLKIPTETNIERKGKLLKELGFVNSETVKQAEKFFERNKDINKIKEITSTQASTIRELKFKYPLEKFITIDELERICTKYKLIHAPAANYIKDVPEKNVLDMANCKPLSNTDRGEDLYRLVGLESNFLLDLFGKKEPIFSVSDLSRINNMNITALKEWFLNGNTTWAYCAARDGIDGKGGSSVSNYRFKRMEKIEKSGFFIAAPKSHFNLKGLNEKSKFGFFNVTTMEVKDPVVFEYCKNNIVRIITKWGTDDDQSYLDPSLTNEINN